MTIELTILLSVISVSAALAFGIRGQSRASRQDATVAFPIPYAAGTEPNVVVGFYSTSTAGTFGRCCVSALDVTNTGFKLRFFNGDSSNRNPSYYWIAMGQPATT